MVGCPIGCVCSLVAVVEGGTELYCNSTCGGAPVQPAPVPVEPAPLPVEPAPLPTQPAPIPMEPAPLPVEPAPLPVEPAPLPVEPAPLPVEPAPLPVEPAPIPTQPAPLPVEPAPIPTQPAPIPMEPAPLPVEPAPLPVEPAPLPVEPAPLPVEPAPLPVEPAPLPVEPAPIPTQPAPLPVEPAPIPTQPAPLPVEPAPIPTQPAPIPTQPAPIPTQPAPLPSEPAPLPVQPAPIPTQPAPIPTQPAPIPSEPAPVGPAPDYNCAVTMPTLPNALPLCGTSVWSCPSTISLPTDLEALCLFDYSKNKCDFVCQSVPNPPQPGNGSGTVDICNGRCSDDYKPAACPVGTSLLGNASGFQAQCLPTYSQTGTVSCSWNTNCACQIQTDSGSEMCGLFPKPSDPCMGKAGTVTSYKCTMSDALGTCIWNVMCVASGGCAGTCPMESIPTVCANGTSVPAGSDFAADCVSDASGACAWKTNCVVDECANACPTQYKPTSCPAPYGLRDVDRTKGVISDCAKPTPNSQCTWVPRNCFPTECRVTLQNSSLYCGSERLGCALGLNVNPVSVCNKKDDGTCFWNYQCPPQDTCIFTPDMTSLVLGGQTIPTCGGKRRPTCGSGQVFSNDCDCGKSTSTCEWTNNCEALVPKPQCYLTRSVRLGWMCGSAPVPTCCADGSRFVPTYCESTSAGGCVSRGYCDRTVVVNIDLNVIINININTTSPAPVPAPIPPPGSLTCSGQDEPKCAMGTPLAPAQCICTDNQYGVRSCSWSSLVCYVDNACDTCANACSDSQYMVSGNCVLGGAPALPGSNHSINNTNANNTNTTIYTNTNSTSGNASGTCKWIGLVCKDKQTTPCACDDIPPSPCAFGKKRDSKSAPVCTRGLSGNCLLESQCIADTCGGLGTSPCQCDYQNCVYVSIGGAAGNSSGGYEGCFAPNSDTFRVLVELPEAHITSAMPNFCGQNAKPQPAPAAPTSCNTCPIVDRCKRTISDETQMTEAIKVFVDTQTQIRNSIDKQTGCALGKHFSLSVIVIGTPAVKTDLSMDLTVVVNFVALEKVVTPSNDHKRVYCPCVKKFLSKLAKFDDKDADEKDCNWDKLMKGSPKRGMLQDGSSSANDNTFTATVSYPSTAVKRVFATTPDTTTGSTTPSNTSTPTTPRGNNTSGQEPVGGSGNVSRALFAWIIGAVIAMFFFGF